MVADPFGAKRNDYNTANIVRAIHELGNIIIAVNTGKTGEHPTLEDCLLRFKRIFEDVQTENQEVNNIKALLTKYRGII
jgi:hypothetical protein